MGTERVFWFRLQSLVCELQQEGDSDFERAINVIEMLDTMTSDDCTDCIADLEKASSMLLELKAVVAGRSVLVALGNGPLPDPAPHHRSHHSPS